MDKEQQYKLQYEIYKLSDRVDTMYKNVEVIGSEVRGVDKKMNDVRERNNLKQLNMTKTEKAIMRILNKLQKDVDGMKQDISFIKSCWIDSAQHYDDQDEDEDEEDEHQYHGNNHQEYDGY